MHRRNVLVGLIYVSGRFQSRGELKAVVARKIGTEGRYWQVDWERSISVPSERKPLGDSTPSTCAVTRR